jgi:hypothetical protein
MKDVKIAALIAASTLSLQCGDVGVDPISGEPEEITSASGLERRIEWDGYVYVGAGADVPTIQRVIQRQVKSAIGALRQPEIAIQDRDALSNIDPSGWTRENLTAIDPANPTGPRFQVQRVRYKYRDVAVIRRGRTSRTVLVPLLFGEYEPRAQEIRLVCSDDPNAEANSLWYHFAPSQPACARAMREETAAINRAASTLSTRMPADLDPRTVISKTELDRRYITVSANLLPVAEPAPRFPEYDRLWGFGSDRGSVVVYAFFGVDSDLNNTRDNSLIEHMRFWRTMRARFPQFRVTETRPQAMLLDFRVAGQRFSAQYEDVFRWILDDAGFPVQVGTDRARREELKRQVIERFSERWIYWDLPVQVSRNGVSRPMTVQIRSYWGHEDGTPAWRQAARNRYLEAFWHADVFLYQGHSHFGHGPLEPTGYSAANFPSRYQLMLVNSCVSFNYYNQDFLALHPGGSRNLEMVVNGLPAYWTQMGQASANYVIGLIDGQNRSWKDILQQMVVTPSWQPSGYDPIRVVNGELDNVFDPARGAVQVTVR